MEVSNQIIEVLDKIAQQFGVAIDWTSKNVVPYIKELCSKYTIYNIICCIIGTVIGFLLIVVPPIILHRIRKSYNEDEWWDYCGDLTGKGLLNIIYISICVVAIIVGVIIFPVFLTSLIKWCCMPELAIFESLKHLIK